MSQKIKKQIKRSMPWFMIISLLFGTVAAGLVFNLDVKIHQTLDKKISVIFSKSEAEANADMATTTVSVRNNPPSFTAQAIESPSSTSTSPINVGAAIGYNATAHDTEGNSYYLVICSTNSVTASSTGGPPTCGATQFCISSLTASDAQASCTYNNVADPPGEREDWYAFVCDNHASQGECSSASASSGWQVQDNYSPFYVNHAPTFTAVVTSNDYKDPGGTFTIIASSTDPDTTRGAEVLHLYLCNTNSWATSTGCASGQLCYATSTSPDIDCSFATTTPAAHGTWTYYAFVRDDFYMPAPQNSRSNSYHVNNVAPTVDNVMLHSGIDIYLNIKGAAEVEASTTSASIRDNNGCMDIVAATSTIYWASTTGAQECTPDDNNCYQIASSNCQPDASSCTGSTDLFMTYTCSTTLAFYALPTDNSAGNPASTTKWYGSIRAFDEALSGASSTPFLSGVEVITSTALDVPESQIAYGVVRSGQDTGSSTATTTVTNFGNSPLDTQLIGTDMTQAPSYWIGAPNQEFDLTYRFTWGTGTDLSSTTPQTVNTVTPKPTSPADVSDNIYWGTGIPIGQMSGDYEGTNTFTAALDNDNW